VAFSSGNHAQGVALAARMVGTTAIVGIRATTPGALTFPILKSNLTGVLLVGDDEVRAAVRFLDPDLLIAMLRGL
jgi:threonine dehydratase